MVHDGTHFGSRTFDSSEFYAAANLVLYAEGDGDHSRAGILYGPELQSPFLSELPSIGCW